MSIWNRYSIVLIPFILYTLACSDPAAYEEGEMMAGTTAGTAAGATAGVNAGVNSVTPAVDGRLGLYSVTALHTR